MNQPEQYEKEEKGREVQEKAEEKEQEKHYEKVEEKQIAEKSRRDPLATLIWALILIWAGVVFLAGNLGFLDEIAILGDMSAWEIVLTGAGILILLEAVARGLIPEYRRPYLGTLILALFLLSMGLGPSFGWTLILAIGLIVIGVVVLLGGFIQRS